MPMDDEGRQPGVSRSKSRSRAGAGIRQSRSGAEVITWQEQGMSRSRGGAGQEQEGTMVGAKFEKLQNMTNRNFLAQFVYKYSYISLKRISRDQVILCLRVKMP